MPLKFARLAGLGAMGAGAGILGLYLLFVFLTRPTGGAGMDWTHRALTWISVGGVALALVAVHVLLGAQLMAVGRGERREP